MIREKQAIEDMGFERMLTLKDLRDVLGVSYGVVLGHISNTATYGRIRPRESL